MDGRTLPFGADDSGWIVAATLLEQGALLDGEERQFFLRDAIEIAEELIGAEEVVRLSTTDWENRDQSAVDPIILLADAAHFAGALHTAAAMFDALLLVDPSLGDVTRGRILAKRARVTHKMGRLEEAGELYRRVDVIGKGAKSAELRARAALGFVTLAQLKGNYPQLARFARRVARWADPAGLRDLSRQAHYALALAAAKAGRFDEALVEGWKTFELSRGDALAEAMILNNLGQLALESGDVQSARSAFAIVVARELPLDLLLPALGGLAVASARLGEEAAVEWAAREVLALRGSISVRYVVAATLLECATAMMAVGRAPEAESYRQQALRMSNAHGFHEITFAADLLDTTLRPAATAPPVWTGAVARVSAWLFEMAPQSLPSHVCVAEVVDA